MRSETFKKIIATLWCFLFAFSLFILFSNTHFHSVNNGFLISHSHPYDKNQQDNFPEKSHHHSDLEFLIYFSVASINGLILLFFIIFIFLILMKYHFLFDTVIHCNSTYQFPTLRAPPCRCEFNR